MKNIDLLITREAKSISLQRMKPWPDRNILFFKKNVISKYTRRECMMRVIHLYYSPRKKTSQSKKSESIALIFCQNNAWSFIAISMNDRSKCVRTRNVHETPWKMENYMENTLSEKFFQEEKIDFLQNTI